MFAVLETVTVPRRIRMFRAGYAIAEHEYPRYLSVTLEVFLGTREKELRARSLRGFRYVARIGLKGIVLPSGFPYANLAAECGLAVSSPVPLLRRMAAALCRCAVESAGILWERVRLTLIGRRSTPELLNAAQTLSAEARAVHIDAGADSEALCYLLRSRCGIAASSRPAKAGEGFYDVYILFEEPERKLFVPDGAPVLNLTGGIPALTGGRVIDGALFEPPRSMRRDWPESCDNAAMLAALLATEQISVGEIGIQGLTNGGSPVKING